LILCTPIALPARASIAEPARSVGDAAMATVFGLSDVIFFVSHRSRLCGKTTQALISMDDDSVYGGYTVVGHHFGGDVGGGAGSVVDKKVGRSQERPEIG
jgi:hypothetical protein